MKTQCPACQHVQYIPEHYANKEIKCSNCKEPFVATEYHEPAAAPEPPPKPKPTPRPKLPSSHWLDVMAILGIFFSILGIIFSIADQSANGFFFCVLWIFLCFILIGISDIVDAVNANTQSRRRGYDE